MFHYFTSLFSLLFASNFSLRFTLVIFASKQNKAKQNSSLFFRFFLFFLTFFCFFHFFSLFFALNFSLRFDLVIFASKQNKAKRNSSLFFCFTSLFSLNFRLFYLRFRFRGFFSLPSKAKFSLQFQISLLKRK